MRCPKCNQHQPAGDICRHCGLVFAKYALAQQRAQAARPALTIITSHAFPYQFVQQLLLLVLLSGLGFALWSHWNMNQLPPPDFYDQGQLDEPRQTPTDASVFQIEAHGIRYTIEPRFDYQLDGVVVSLHDSDVFWDIYHFGDWQDFINLRDLCVVWGDNVSSGVFRQMHYSNTTWTCWISANHPDAASSFAWNQISNNHLLTPDPGIREAIKSAEIGDQIRLDGKLAQYSHAGGFQRGTSITRDDTGNGACETIYVEGFRITRKSHPGWRLMYRIALTITLATFLGLALIFVVAPVTAPR